jgi:hypothetical protein
MVKTQSHPTQRPAPALSPTGGGAPASKNSDVPSHDASPELLVRRRPQGSAQLFEVRTELPPALFVGQMHEGEVIVLPIDPWKVNPEVSARLQWQSHASLAIEDMAPGGEVSRAGSDASNLRFPLKVRAYSRGQHRLRGIIDAGFCRDGSCLAIHEAFEIDVNIDQVQEHGGSANVTKASTESNSLAKD